MAATVTSILCLVISLCVIDITRSQYIMSWQNTLSLMNNTQSCKRMLGRCQLSTSKCRGGRSWPDFDCDVKGKVCCIPGTHRADKECIYASGYCTRGKVCPQNSRKIIDNDTTLCRKKGKICCRVPRQICSAVKGKCVEIDYACKGRKWRDYNCRECSRVCCIPGSESQDKRCIQRQGYCTSKGKSCPSKKGQILGSGLCRKKNEKCCHVLTN